MIIFNTWNQIMWSDSTLHHEKIPATCGKVSRLGTSKESLCGFKMIKNWKPLKTPKVLYRRAKELLSLDKGIVKRPQKFSSRKSNRLWNLFLNPWSQCSSEIKAEKISIRFIQLLFLDKASESVEKTEQKIFYV